MKEVLDFLTELSVHNNREWFAENKTWYQRCYARFNEVCAEYIRQLAKIEPKQLVILDVYENCAYDIQQELKMKECH